MTRFQKQLLPIIKERFRNNEREQERYLRESSTPAAITLISYIRQWEFASRNIALARLLECNRWAKNGTMVLERNWKGRPYPFKVPLAMAWEWYIFGDLHEQYVPISSLAGRVKNIPDNITDDWREEIQGLFNDINRMSVNAYRIIVLAKCVKSYGVNNPYTFTTWDRQVSEFKDAQAAIDAYVENREGWKHLTTQNLQNPEHAKAMGKVLEDILAKADAMVEPSVKAIREQDRKLHIRQDATGARNHVKSLGQFFKKYAVPEPNALALLGGIIDDVESQVG